MILKYPNIKIKLKKELYNMQEFFIIKGSTNPVLEMELIDDGKY